MKNLRSIVPALLFAVFLGGVCLAQDDGHAPRSFWLPERASSDELPVRIDYLFNLILWITGIAMVLVFAAMVYFLIKYREVPGRKAKFVHGNHTVEMVWTIVPAIILVWLGFTQVPDWSRAKVPSSFPATPEESTLVQVAAQQFDWNFRQPGLDGKFESYNVEKAMAALEEAKSDPDAEVLTEFNPAANKFFGKEDDDDIVQATLTVPVNKPVLIELRSIDVIHSFFIPVMRLKQDAVPGKPMPVWFKPTKVGEWEIACAELCGNNHTTMRSRVIVLPQDQYDAWLKAESEKKVGAIERGEGVENVWMHWFRQGVRPRPGGMLTKPWNDVKIAKQEALKARGH